MLEDTTLRDTTGPAADDDKGLAVVERAHYVINREIARGGMGRVLGARDRRLGREVAIKEVLAGDASLARRFEREARITARLQHPSIVSVHEAGSWPTGEPFFVMPLVSGRSLDERIVAAKRFDERLALVPNVLAIADAMAYAHGQRVIHRDLKPKNIVVGEYGETIVLDWGVAKQLDARDDDSGAGGSNPRSDETAAGDLLGTPTYMPPEQAAGPAVDERADVYAIGAILYHVLAGRPPYVGETVGDVIAMLTTRPPPPVAQYAPDAPPELIAIVEHAMARDPAARYPTARELADDLRRFQTGQLVGAHRYSLRQLLGRWARRHVTVLAAIAAAIAVGVGVGVVALVKVVDAERLAEDQRTLAVANRRDAEDLLEYMLVDLRSKLQSVGRLELLETVARKASAYYDTHGTLSDEDAHLAAEARLGIALVLEYRGDLPGTRAELWKAKAIFDVLSVTRSEVLAFRLGALEAELDLARVDAAQGDLESSLRGLRDALARAEQLRTEHPADVRVLHVIAIAHEHIAGILEQRGQPDAALAEYRNQLATYHQPPGIDALVDKDLLNAHANIGNLLFNAKHDVAGALSEQRLALAIGLDEAAKDPRSTKWRSDIAISHREIGELLAEQGDDAGALAEYRESVDLEQRLVERDPANTDWQTGLATAHERVGTVLFRRKDIANALVEYRATAAIYSELAQRDPTNTDWQRSNSVALNKLGDVQREAGELVAAEASFRGALAIRERLVAKDPSRTRWQRDLFFSHAELADLYAKQTDHARSAAELRIAIDIAERIAAAHPTNEAAQNDVAAARESLGDALVALKDVKGARAAYTSSLAIANRFATQPDPDPSWRTLVDHLTTKLSHLSTSSS